MPLAMKYIRHVTIGFVILSWISTPFSMAKKKYTCPIGFSIAYTREKGHPICYRLKGPESFSDKYTDCVGNLYTSKLYLDLNFTSPNMVLWTEFRSLYPGGTFVDWSFTKSMGTELDSSFEVNIDPTIDIGEELCVAMDPISNFTAVKCSDKYFSYCFVRPYSDEEDISDIGCEDIRDAVRFWSPESTCLTVLTGVAGGLVRATWKQAQDLCGKRGSSLMYRGWRYSNSPIFHDAGYNNTYPLGVVMNSEFTSLRYDTVYDQSEVPASDWNFNETSNNNSDTLLGALRDDFWYLVNGSYIFFDVICERSVTIKKLSMNLNIDIDNKITLTINDTIDSDKVFCYTDSIQRYPTKVGKRRKDDTNTFIVKPEKDGYYWCTHVDVKHYETAESNKILFIREKQSVVNVFAVKLRHQKRLKLDVIDKMSKLWEMKLKEYIYFRNKYESVFGELNSNKSEETLKSFKLSNPGLEWKDKSIIEKIKVQRLYLDAQDVLLHVELSPNIFAVSPGVWDGLEIMYMKPVYYCKGFDTVPTVALGDSIASFGCRTHTCVGDFNDGVQWVTSATRDCSTPVTYYIDAEVEVNTEVHYVMPTANPTPETLRHSTDSSSESTEDEDVVTKDEILTATPSLPPDEILTGTPYITTEGIATGTPFIPTDLTPPSLSTTPAPPRPPEEVLQQVMDDLMSLTDDTNPIFVENITTVFDQVDHLLEDSDDLTIPSQMLHMLDRLGSTIKLNGSHVATAVRSNIALVMADATPNNPVRGIRIAARSDDVFVNDAFQVISVAPNETSLQRGDSEAVVVLPGSVSDSQRRVSFVVFRNDKAFQNTDLHAVNSRVLSIKVENVTKFTGGEVIDIHLSPISSNISRNQSRTCGYWNFLDDGSGSWSQDGCTFIPSTGNGVLDTCRCTHLTHFAEILIPKEVFSERHENILEMITVIGCCVSLFGLSLVAVTAIMFRSWRRDFSNKIWLQLCIAIFLMALTFIVVVFARFSTYNIPCMLIGVALHYSVLASFCWMLVAAVLSYRRLVLVFTRDASHKLLRASVFSWGLPCAIVGILLSVAPHSYAGRFEEKTPTGAFCYPSGVSLWVTVYAPICAVIFVNWTLFILIVRSVFASRRIQRHGDTNEALRCASVSCLLVFLFGLPWIFGLFASNIVSAYLFTLTASYQGFILFIFFVVGNKKTRDLWLNKLKIKQTRKVPVTSSSYSNRSTGWRPNTNTTIETKVSKPKSLSTPDDSRFS
ncbi:uncharacterized protein LOC111001031 isoform X1 [Pieris rapae]|uniref:uncharacterized protein LOC111001031 isoform X1 n=1 Tax=Pieris rapae TaxID=64459 RepID=UPI001E279EA1|nr:uncharacterized protein LOC111001031 isoform X1 [Pieris rapae]XP_045485065.1 uncharacterized protein LOC111001031 isoform X1 [Pieris rapae]